MDYLSDPLVYRGIDLHEGSLGDASRWTELENIQTAIRQGVLTPTTRTMLTETEDRITRLEAAIQAPAQKSKIAYLPGVVEACLRDLKGTFATDPDHARALVAKLIGKITLRQKDGRLWAEMQGNLAGLLEIDEVGNGGAGRGILFERRAQVRLV